MRGLDFTLLELIGWLAQGFFFVRFLVQWWASERAGRIVVPTLFWWMSLGGAIGKFTYAFSERSLIFIATPTVNVFVYARNLMLARTGRSLERGTLLPVALGLATLIAVGLIAKLSLEGPPLWLTIGILGELCWMSRFPLQWYLSEKQGRATLPPTFYWVSLVGSLLLLAYALHAWNAIWIAGMSLGPILYTRGLWLSYHPRPQPQPPKPVTPPTPPS